MSVDPKISLIADWLEKQAQDSSITDGRIMEILGVSNGSFYRSKPKALQEVTRRAQLRQEALDKVNVQSAEQGAKKGLKSKLDRVLILQNQIDEILNDLEDGTDPVSGKPLDTYERVALRKNLRDLQAEISKIEGDYAAEKKEHSFEKGFFDFLKETSDS